MLTYNGKEKNDNYEYQRRRGSNKFRCCSVTGKAHSSSLAFGDWIIAYYQAGLALVTKLSDVKTIKKKGQNRNMYRNTYSLIVGKDEGDFNVPTE